MKRKLPPKVALVAVALFGIAFGTAYGSTSVSWNASVSNSWENASNWTPALEPTNNTFDVTVGVSSACNLSSGFQINALTLSINAANLNLVPGATLAFTSDVTNNGAILVNTTAANTTTKLRFDANAQITGSGGIQLNGVGFNVADLDANGVTVTIGANQTVHGRGTLLTENNGIFINNGILNCDVNGGGLGLEFANSPNGSQNNGTFKATNGGELVVDAGTTDQTGGGTILADGTGSIVDLGRQNGLSTATIIGGTLSTANNGTIVGNSVLLTGCTNSGTFKIPANSNGISGIVLVTGAGLTNNGTITVNPDAQSVTAKLRFDASGQLGGIGSVLLNGIGFNVADLDVNGVTVTIGANQTVHGRGTLLTENNGIFINNGVISADVNGGNIGVEFAGGSFASKNNGTIKGTNGGDLILDAGTTDQTGGGTILADGSGSIVDLGRTNGASTATIIGGTLATLNGGLMHGNAVVLGNNITNSGAYDVPAGLSTFIAGTALTNNGSMTVNANSSTFRFDADTVVSGSGAIIPTNGATLNINGHSVTNGPNHTIKGNGSIAMNGGSLTNNGIIAPGLSAGQLNYSGTLTLGSTSNLSFEIGGTTQSTQYDLLGKTDGAPQTLGGQLTVRLINGFTPTASDTFTILTTQATLGGAFSNVASGQRLNTAEGSGSFIVTYSGNNVVLSSFAGTPTPTPTPTPTATPTATPTPSRLLNIATRMRVQTGENVLIGGFIITGTDAKKVIIRGIGPSLSQFFSGTLADPTLELYQGNTLLTTNDDWKTRPDGGSQQAEVEATGIPPSNNLESAIVQTLAPGGYTAILRGKGNATGIGVVETYDLNQSANSKLGNIATRGFVDTGDNVMIGGLIVGPAGGSSTKVVVRAIGPSLTNFGIAGALQDPTLELHDGNGVTVASNDNWKTRPDGSSQQAEIEATGLQPSDDRESALLQTVMPGNYTAIVRGKNSTTGVGLVEVYNLQ